MRAHLVHSTLSTSSLAKSANVCFCAACGGKPDIPHPKPTLLIPNQSFGRNSLDLPIGLSHRPRDKSVVSFLHCMNDPQPEGHMASHIGRRKFLATLGSHHACLAVFFGLGWVIGL
jgi:hypothetical protein